MLERVAPSQAVTLNRAVTVAMTRGPANGLGIIDGLLENPACAGPTAPTPSVPICSR